MNKESKEEKDQQPKFTLSSFIEENQKLLTVIGVLTALAVFWSNQPLKKISTFISFLCLAATIPIFLEIYRKSVSNKSWLLIIFLNIFTPMMGYIGWYLLLNFRSEWKSQLSKIVFWSIFIPLWVLFRKFDITQRIMNQLDKLSVLSSPKIHTLLHPFLNPLYRKIASLYGVKFPADGEELTEAQRSEFLTNLDRMSKQNSKITHVVLTGCFLIILAFPIVPLSNYIAEKVNRKLDNVYETYKADEQSPEASLSK